MSKQKSANCKPGDKPSTLFSFSASAPGSNEEYHSFMLSCQSERKDEPDQKTMQSMREAAAQNIAKTAGAPVSVDSVVIDQTHGVPLGMQSLKEAAAEISRHRMASNCKRFGYDLKHVTAHNRFRCRYLGGGIDEDGNHVQNPFQEWRGTLSSCDDSIKLPDDVLHDVKRLAWDAAGGDDAKLDISKFHCEIQSLPMQ